MEEFEVSNLMCRHCKYSGKECKCINHRYIHFYRPYFSCDTFTEHHTICSAFQPSGAAPAITKEWEDLGGFKKWHNLFIEQWCHGKPPFCYAALILAINPTKGREFGDDIYYVPYQDFVDCNIMRPDGIHYDKYCHIEISRKSPIGYEWKEEAPGMLRYEELEKLIEERGLRYI